MAIFVIIGFMAEGDKVYSFDGDGVIFFRLPVQAAIFRPRVDFPRVSGSIPRSQELVDIPLGLREYPSYLMHLFHFVYPGAKRTLSLLDGDIYLNTGRRNIKPWVDLTLRSLDRAGIGNLFRGFYFCPRGLSTGFSKLVAVAELRNQYKKVVHFDDNPFDGIPIARYFSDVQVVLIKDWSTRLLLWRLKIDLDQSDNVIVAENLHEAILASKGRAL